ncbi:PQQ-binding-like beta-propeller repeat protein [Halostagnicola sp. A-GB9-2]|uniref:outer membrane protein assembly factor BamB family protein n=1 Tax=Halostagnicola sp. A-GB9-2 TaxID=3048066 RepID=UPI0024C0BBF2|nr:PQQ-binding-like beta-propeller repeat protein [Halostagnicola sp. A-GB9-2]MDJ1432132.1 PQQ-binding-like beta-propeller repeat protein [Halostagnicola sp. A-GB9-2]
MSDDRATRSRRQVLGAIAAGTSAVVAGCGYQPGGGDLDWQESTGHNVGFGSSSNERWRSDGTHLFRIRNRSGREPASGGFEDVDGAYVTAYDSSGSTVWSGDAGSEYTGVPSIANGRVFFSLEDETVAALERSPSDDDSGGNSTDDAETAWTTDWDGPSLALSASDDLVVGVHEGGAVGFDSDSGEERFVLDLEAEPFDEIDSVAVGGEIVWVVAVDTDSSDGNDGDPDDNANTDTNNDNDDADNEDTNNDGTETSVLLGYDSAGGVVVDRSLPSTPSWLEAAGSVALVGVETSDDEDELWLIDDSGDRRERLALERASSEPIVVGETASFDAGGTISAIDTSTGERSWTTEAYTTRGDVAADSDRLYVQGTTEGMDRCGLIALDHDGEEAWTASLPTEVGCSGELFVLEDRLVVVDDGELYGFRKTSGRRFTLL